MDLGDPNAVRLLSVVNQKTRKNSTNLPFFSDLKEMIGHQLLNKKKKNAEDNRVREQDPGTSLKGINSLIDALWD